MSSAHSDRPKEHILAMIRRAGAADAGVCRVEPVDQADRDIYDSWTGGGRNANMEYMARNTQVRNDPSLLLPGAASLIMSVWPYPLPSRATTVPHIASYAMRRDYHRVLRKLLEPVCDIMRTAYGAESRVCIDSAPLRERYWATRAGLGFLGLNGRLISPVAGCDFFIATILTTLELTPDTPCQTDACLQCGRCVKACPNGALDGRGGLDARLCISYHTIENKGDIPQHINLAGNIFGCDICSAVCPLSSRSDNIIPPEGLATRTDITTLSIDDWLEMPPERYEELFNGTPVRRASLEKLKSTARRLKQTPH